METVVFGHSGAPVLVFPTSRGRFYQWEDFGLVETLRHKIEQGWLQLFCVDGIDNETWYDFERPQSEILELHSAYDRYLGEEYVPFLRSRNSTEFLIATGTSFGAYQAANFSFRHPALVQRLVGMSGDYDVRKYLDDFYDLNVYFHNPVDYLPLLTDEQILADLRKMEIILGVGETDFCLGPSIRLADTLRGLGTRCRLDVWGADAIHDWPTWKRMALVYL